jgi:hypothetical protein
MDLNKKLQPDHHSLASESDSSPHLFIKESGANRFSDPSNLSKFGSEEHKVMGPFSKA